MAPKTILFAASAIAGAALVAAQAAPNWEYIPSACATDCSQTVEISYLCQTQYGSDSTSIYGCFCNDYPSDASTCATCLNNNNAAALANLLTSTQSACPEAIKQCFFECSFDTCDSSDVACQCDGTYLANIYNCASCNTANGNTGATTLDNFNALQESCANQNYTGASQSFTTEPLPTASTDGYMAPSLTATGGGLAATGDVTASGGGLAAGGASATEAAGSVAVTATSATIGASSASAAGGSSARMSTSARASGSASGSSSGTSASAAAQSTGAAAGLAAPAFGGLLGLVGAVAALL